MSKNQIVVLVVDDDKISRMLPSMLLRTYDVTVIECDNGADALKYMESNDVDYMLIDISMPSISGVDLLKRLSARSKSNETILIAYTADVNFGDIDYFRMLGFHYLLTKPIAADDLLKLMCIGVD